MEIAPEWEEKKVSFTVPGITLKNKAGQEEMKIELG